LEFTATSVKKSILIATYHGKIYYLPHGLDKYFGELGTNVNPTVRKEI